MSDDKVVYFGGATRLDLPPRRILEGALEHEFERVVVIGKLRSGERYVAFSDADLAHALWEMERARQVLLQGSDV